MKEIKTYHSFYSIILQNSSCLLHSSEIVHFRFVQMDRLQIKQKALIYTAFSADLFSYVGIAADESIVEQVEEDPERVPADVFYVRVHPVISRHFV